MTTSARHPLVVFDLDGTISDPLVGIGRSINYALASFGHAELELSELGAYIGPPLDETFRQLVGVKAQAEIDGLVAKYRERYADVGYAENVMYPGVAQVLERLRERGIRLGVCTSKRRDFAEQILEMFAVRRHFAFVSGGEIGTPKWRQLEALVAVGEVTTDTVMVGDRAIDLQAAHKNGLHAAAVLWGYGSADELSRERPRYAFSTPPEILQLAD